jgi:hypothetical protein
MISRLRFSRLGTIKYFIPIKTSLDVKRLRSIWERELRDKARLYVHEWIVKWDSRRFVRIYY